MTYEYLTVTIISGSNGEYIVSRVNEMTVEEYEQSLTPPPTPAYSAWPRKGKQPVTLVSIPVPVPQPRPLSQYLNLLGQRGWEISVAINPNLMILKKPA